jgi:hypothetical protein
MSSSFARMAGWCGIVAGLAALAYSVTFAVVVQNGDRWAQWSSALLLGLGALAALPVVIALFLRVRDADEGFAMLAVAVGVLGAGGTLFHAMFDLGNLANDPGRPFDYPSPTDPRGFSTFLLAGLTVALFSLLLGRTGAPRGLVRLGVVVAVLLVWVWIGRLTALDPKAGWVAPAVLGSGFIGVPLWYCWNGRLLLRSPADAVERRPSGRLIALSPAGGSSERLKPVRG